MTRLVRFPAAAAMHAEAAAFLEAHRGGASEMLVLAPSRSAADDLLRKVCGEGLLGVHTLTLSHLAAQLASPELARWGLAPVSMLGLEALVARVVHELRASRRLPYFHPVADTPGFVRAAARTLTELRMENVGAAELAATGAPGADLARLHLDFAAQLQQQSLSDQATLYGLALKAAGDGTHRVLGLPVLMLDVAVRSARQRELVAAFVQRSPAVLAVTLEADEESRKHLEAALGVAAEIGAVDGDAREEKTLARLRRQVFETHLEAAPVDDSLAVFSAPGEGLECVEISRRIQKLAAAGLPFDAMAALMRNPEKYQPLLEDALRRAGIPAFFPRGSARPDPAGRAFLALLQCAAEDCSASRFAEYLSLAQVPDLDAGGGPVRVERGFTPPQDELLAGFQPDADTGESPQGEAAGPGPVITAPRGWEQLLVDAAVVGGRARWERRIDGYEEELKLQLSSAESEGTSRRLEQLSALRGFALPVIGLLDALPRRAKWTEWLTALIELAETTLRAPEAVLAVLNELRPMGEVGPATLDEVYGVLQDRLRFLRADPPSRRYGAVFCGTIEEARAHRFDVVFLPGLTEGVFPRKAYEDPLLLDHYRRALPHPLPGRDQLVARERLLLAVAAGAAEQQLVVSYPRMDTAQSRPRVPSFYALEVVRAAEGALPELRKFQERAAKAAPSRLGWPAPADPREAIDDTEYDIASLRQFEDLPPERRRGVGRYLLAVNTHLARSLRTRWLRWKNAWSWADGLVASKDAPTAGLLEAHRLSARVYSATSLQQYASCPYRFFLQAVHGLRERDGIAALEQLDPLTRGALFHEAQFTFFQAMKHEGLLPLDRSRLAPALEHADRALNQVAEQWREKLAPAIDRVWVSEIEDLRTDLRTWARHVATIDDEWTPVHFELGFGLKERGGSRDDASRAEDVAPMAGVRLRGSIDLVERHRESGLIRITDHKTGRPLDKAPMAVGGGAVLQPLLYSLAAGQMLGQPVSMGRLFYCTQRGGYKEYSVPVKPIARQHLEQVLEGIDEALAQGFLPAAPAREACTMCDYERVCGPREEERLRRKPAERLDALNRLRGLP
ncbi:MAG: Dna2/Cas4 domain-containing protein [Acidobacteria bacterium]|nr:Dna2/Cas4 domain-containing protein [Acidobacteriota bacterium]